MSKRIATISTFLPLALVSLALILIMGTPNGESHVGKVLLYSATALNFIVMIVTWMSRRHDRPAQ
jgi:hypothetical protein